MASMQHVRKFAVTTAVQLTKSEKKPGVAAGFCKYKLSEIGLLLVE